MALLKIVHYPDPRLHKIAQPIATVDDNIKALIANMAETMYSAPGVGLAATQVDRHVRLILVDISESKNDLKVFINPEILEASGQSEHEEGCLSVPGIYDTVTRPERVRVRALDRDGQPFELEADGLMAVCVQHEIDHLHGKVFVEYLSQLKQMRIRSKLKKRLRETL